jgi:DNA-binding NtrC family response regulator
MDRARVNGSVTAVAVLEIAPPRPKPPALPVITKLATVLDSAVPVLEQVAKAKREAERAAILAVLEATRWNRREAAGLLHIDYKALLYEMKGLSIKKEKAVLKPQHDEADSASFLNGKCTESPTPVAATPAFAD